MREKEYERERNKTITFRLSEFEKKFLEAKIQACNVKKTDYYVKACLYNQVVVVGKREHIDRLIEQLQEMELLLKVLLDEIQREANKEVTEEIMRIKDDYIAMVTAIYEIAKAGNRDIKRAPY